VEALAQVALQVQAEAAGPLVQLARQVVAVQAGQPDSRVCMVWTDQIQEDGLPMILIQLHQQTQNSVLTITPFQRPQ
jgi:hypothetical protein